MKSLFLLVVAMLAFFLSTFDLILLRHSIRHSLNSLNDLNNKVSQLQLQNNELRLEYAHLSNNYRIEKIAVNELSMNYPDVVIENTDYEK